MARRYLLLVAAAVLALATPVALTVPASAAVPISGSGSTWAQTAVDQWRRDVVNQGLQINYSGTGSTDGRRQFLNGTTDFAVSDIPFQFKPEDNSEPETPVAGSYAYMPVTAGGTVFMYNLTINGQRVTNLRLSGENVSKIFTGVLTQWNDPAIAADNPGLTLPARKIVPVVRSDGSGSSAQFSLWMVNRFPQLWRDYCAKVGRQNACGFTSFYPSVPGMVSQTGDLGVSGYVSQSYGEGAIGYVNYSYALNTGFPVAKILNKAGYYTEPTASNVAVSLSKAKVNTRDKNNPALYLTQDLSQVYTSTDPRTYELSSYSYFILPTTVQGQFTQDKGATLATFAYYFMCQGQQKAEQMGYSPLPINLVKAGFDQIRKIPGANAQSINVQQCNNPTFSPDGHNKLIDSAPMPDPKDKKGYAGGQNTAGSGGAKDPTPVKPVAQQNPPAQGQPQQNQPQQNQPQQGQPQQNQPQQNRPQQNRPQQGQPQQGQPQQNQPQQNQPQQNQPQQTAAQPDQTRSGAVRRTSGSRVQSSAPVTRPGASRSGTAPSRARGARPTAVATSGATGGVQGGAAPACDPDTGACADGANQGGANPDVQLAAGDVAASNVAVVAPSGWGSAQTLMVIAAVCALLLFVLPPLVARRLEHGSRADGTR